MPPGTQNWAPYRFFIGLLPSGWTTWTNIGDFDVVLAHIWLTQDGSGTTDQIALSYNEYNVIANYEIDLYPSVEKGPVTWDGIADLGQITGLDIHSSTGHTQALVSGYLVFPQSYAILP